MEYLVPVLTTKKKLEDKIVEYKDTLNLYLPEDMHFKDKNILGMEKKNKVADEDSSLSERKPKTIRQFQAERSNILMAEKPNILDAYMELIIQFGYVVLFSEVFPLGALMSFISNGIQQRSQLTNMQYQRRFKPEVGNGIGNWM